MVLQKLSRPEHASGSPSGRPSADDARISAAGYVGPRSARAEPEDEDDDGVKPLPDRLLSELTAERTLALRDKLATTPSVAFASRRRAITRTSVSRSAS